MHFSKLLSQCSTKTCILGFIILALTESLSINNTAQLISTYAKVAHWGAGDPSKTLVDVGRSAGQSSWTSRVNTNNLKKQKEATRYHYSMKVPSSKFDQSVGEDVPSKGEVQERFNPRPYFDFTFDSPSKRPDSSKPDIAASQSKPTSVVYASPLNSKPSDLYSSPFSSYNPPQFSSNTFQNSPVQLADFPPFQPNSSFNPMTKPPPPPQVIYRPPSYDIPNSKPMPDISKQPPVNDKYPDSFHPPLAAPEYAKHPIFVPQPPEDSDSPMEDQKEEGDKENDSPPQGNEPEFLDHPPSGYDYHYHHSPKPPSMAEQDLAPPPSGNPFYKIPQYLDNKPDEHDFYPYHHDVYHEVTTTSTTTAAPRAGHYSYYYLGRKLWYIPLYFSVYFIVYVTILILKSIARHKIQFTHNFDKSRSFTDSNNDYVNPATVDAVENVNKKFM